MATLKTGIGSKWALGIEGRGYLLSTLDQQSPFEFRAYSIEPVPLRIPRIDFSSEPGEQSLGSLWPRSQSSWHEGSGQEVFDSEFSSRFKSKYIYRGDPFSDKGIIKAFRALDSNASIDFPFWAMVVVGNNLFGFRGSTDIYKYVTKNSNTSQGSVTHNTPTNGQVFHGIATDGSLIYFWNAALGLYSVTTSTDWSSAPTPVKVNDLSSGEAMGFVKNRLMVGIGPNIHDIADLSSVTSGATAHFIHPFSGWEWTSFVEGGPGIFASGYVDSKSAIYHIGFDASTAASGLVLNAPRSVWEAPTGEQILSMASYLGSAILIGTSKGVRNAIIDRDGNLQVSALIVDNTEWAFSGNDPECGAVIINSDRGYFAHSNTIQPNGGSIRSTAGIINLGNLAWTVYDGPIGSNRKVKSLVMWGDDLVLSDSTETVQPGSGSTSPVIVTGDIRFGTSEVKVLRKLVAKFNIPDPSWVMSTYNSTSKRCQIFQSSLRGGRNLSDDTDANVKDKRLVCALVHINSFDLGPFPTSNSVIIATQGDPFGSTPTNPLQNESILWEAILSKGNEDGGGNTNKMAFRWKDADGVIQEAISTITLASQKTNEGYVNDSWYWFAWEFDGSGGTSGVWRVRFYSWYWEDTTGDKESHTTWEQVGADVEGGAASELYKPVPDIDYHIFMGGGSKTGSTDSIAALKVYESAAAEDNKIMWWLGTNQEIDFYGNLFNRVSRLFDSSNNKFITEDPSYPMDLESHFGDVSRFSSILVSIDGGPFSELKYPEPWGDTVKLYGQEHDLDNLLSGIRFNFIFFLSGLDYDTDSGLMEWRLRAEPIPRPRYLIHYVPIMLYDRMTTLDSQHVDRKGLARDELTFLKNLYREGTLIDFQPPDLGPAIKVRIDELRFKEFAPPKGASGFGGIVLLTLKEQE